MIRLYENNQPATVREFVQQVLLDIANFTRQRFLKIGNPGPMVSNIEKEIADLESGNLPKIGGDTEVLDNAYISHESKIGRGGNTYYVINGNINFYPNAQYGPFIKKIKS